MTKYNPQQFNLTMMTDLYQLTMMQGYFYSDYQKEVVFDMFYRRLPFKGGYAIFAGLEPFLKALQGFSFTKEDLAYLKSLGIFRDEFLEYLSKFKFKGTIYSCAEGEVVFPNEPLIRVHANAVEAQLVETLLLNIVNFQTLIATKTSRIAEAAKGRAVLEFGLRRAQGINGALSASRASFIGGATASSNVMAGKLFDIPVKGTMAHSWVMLFESEKESFYRYADLYPEQTVLLVDTYDTLEQGMPAAIEVLKYLKDEKGIKDFGVRIDSGDLEYLANQSREMLDKAGLENAKIVVSNDLDEYIIEELVKKNAAIDSFGVGTNLVTAKGDAALTGVYKLVARKDVKRFTPCIKISNNPEKITNPHIKNVMRLYDENNLMVGDLIFLEEEKNKVLKAADEKEPLIFIHPRFSYSEKKMTSYVKTKVMLEKVMSKGKIICDFPSLTEIQKRSKANLSSLHPSYKRLLNPHIYKVSLTPKLSRLKIKMIKEHQ